MISAIQIANLPIGKLNNPSVGNREKCAARNKANPIGIQTKSQKINVRESAEQMLSERVFRNADYQAFPMENLTFWVSKGLKGLLC